MLVCEHLGSGMQGMEREWFLETGVAGWDGEDHQQDLLEILKVEGARRINTPGFLGS